MTLRAQAVIGAGWGDEGKGVVTDALSARLTERGRDVTVVRSNGGAQAGHGVTLEDGRHHVFHHFGAGSFTGARTHLSRYFVSHPMVFFGELAALESKGASDLRVSVDPRSPITTPWDMAINQAIELARSTDKHGSCGLGFGETLERTEKGPRLVMADLWEPGIRDRLMEIRDLWVPARMSALGLDTPDGPLGAVLDGSGGVLERFMEDLEQYAVRVRMLRDTTLGDCDAVVFEGAQGLGLDMDLGAFPHVTRSHTGVLNMISIAQEAGIEAIEAIYVTRAYATRHGAGPLPHDNGPQPLPGTRVTDRTNAANGWQDAIRYAPLDLRSMERRIDADLARVAGSGVSIDAGIAVTCIDQLTDPIGICIFDDWDGGPLIGPVDPEGIADVIAGQVGRPLKLVSYGPTRDTIRMAGEIQADAPAP